MSIRLKFVFDGSGGKKVALSFPYADSASDPALVKVLAQAVVASGDIYAEPPLAARSADFLICTTIPVDIS